MFKNKTFYIVTILVCFSLLVFIEYMTPKPVNWQRTYSKDDKIPYGSYIVFELLSELFDNRTIQTNYQTFYELSQIFDKASYDDLPNEKYKTNLILFNENFMPDGAETSAMLNIANRGGYFFIASQYFGGTFADTLGIKTSEYVAWKSNYSEKDEKVAISLANPIFAQKQYVFYEHIVPFTFRSLEIKEITRNENIKVLGKKGDQVNFIYIPYGDGGFYLHTCPLIFTNYNMLSNNNEYISTALSYLPTQDVVWDEYYKNGRKESQNQLRFILQHESLKYAWWVFLVSVGLFMFFKAKRTQRIMPIMKLPQNSTLDFTKTVGQLYFQRRDDTDLAKKKIVYFLEYIRTVFYLNTNQLDKEFIESLSAKSGYELNKTKRIFGLIADVQRYNTIAETQLLELSSYIDDFYAFGKIK